MRQMPRERRRGSKLSTHDRGEKRRSDMTRARRPMRRSGWRRAHIQRGLRVAQSVPVDPVRLPVRLRVVVLPGFRAGRRGARGRPTSHEQRRCLDARSGAAGARYASGRQEARPDHRHASRDRQRLTAGRGGARTASRHSPHRGQSWRTTPADGVRTGQRGLAPGCRHGADPDALPGVLLLDRADGQRSVGL